MKVKLTKKNKQSLRTNLRKAPSGPPVACVSSTCKHKFKPHTHVGPRKKTLFLPLCVTCHKPEYVHGKSPRKEQNHPFHHPGAELPPVFITNAKSPTNPSKKRSMTSRGTFKASR